MTPQTLDSGVARPPAPAAVRAVYAEVCRSYHGIDEFRAKLLALLPVASGAAISLLLAPAGGVEAAAPYLPAVGVFGLVASVGLYTYELRGVQTCNALIGLGADLERQIGVPGQFTMRPERVGGVIGTTTASFLVYSSVIAAWAFVAVAGVLKAPASYGVAGAVLIAVLAGSTRLKLDPWFEGPRRQRRT